MFEFIHHSIQFMRLTLLFNAISVRMIWDEKYGEKWVEKKDSSSFESCLRDRSSLINALSSV